jgi:hypothetical protein
MPAVEDICTDAIAIMPRGAAFMARLVESLR